MTTEEGASRERERERSAKSSYVPFAPPLAPAEATSDDDLMSMDAVESDGSSDEEMGAFSSRSVPAAAASISFGVPSSVSRSAASPSASLFGAPPAPAATPPRYNPAQQPVGVAAPSYFAYPQPPQSPQSSEDKVLQLVRLQNFDGSFSPTAPLIGILTQRALGEATSLSLDLTVWGTILAIAYLQKHLTGQPDLLEGLVEKAMDYVQSVGGVDAERLLEKARAIVP